MIMNLILGMVLVVITLLNMSVIMRMVMGAIIAGDLNMSMLVIRVRSMMLMRIVLSIVMIRISVVLTIGFYSLNLCLLIQLTPVSFKTTSLL